MVCTHTPLTSPTDSLNYIYSIFFFFRTTLNVVFFIRITTKKTLNLIASMSILFEQRQICNEIENDCTAIRI